MRDEEVASNVCKVKVNLLPPPLSTHLTPRVCVTALRSLTFGSPMAECSNLAMPLMPANAVS